MSEYGIFSGVLEIVSRIGGLVSRFQRNRLVSTELICESGNLLVERGLCRLDFINL